MYSICLQAYCLHEENRYIFNNWHCWWSPYRRLNRNLWPTMYPYVAKKKIMNKEGADSAESTISNSFAIWTWHPEEGASTNDNTSLVEPPLRARGSCWCFHAQDATNTGTRDLCRLRPFCSVHCAFWRAALRLQAYQEKEKKRNWGVHGGAHKFWTKRSPLYEQF